ncbi:Fic family protein [Bifidobacterium choerinum]|uniref:Fido domain-containing protein n=1 Tax=Bifidobacterium choerinum TaxID=35760 RepID=A0A2D3D658_9BIFI|nr:Fic family protein [Bifidobacterium choerinum]ATU20629.1 hypothetical protein BcFMB_06500 [Bifidobacterium choerinum]
MGLDTKQLAGLLYSMGHTFDNLSSTYIATEEFLRTNNPRVIGSRADLALLEDLRDASSYALHEPAPLDAAFVKGVNARLSRTAALEPGVLRTDRNIMVRTSIGDYIPEVPDEEGMESVLAEARHGDGGLFGAAQLFARLARMQPFGDGNKRTALLVANRLLLDHGTGRALIVPTQDPDRRTFNDLMGLWYVREDVRVMRWLADYNEDIAGLDEYGRPITRAGCMPRPCGAMGRDGSREGEDG